MYTLGNAAKASGFSKSTLSRAIKAGRLSATKQEDGSYAVNPAELERWVAGNGHRNSAKTQIATPEQPLKNTDETGVLQAELDAARQLAADRQKTIDDLRTRLDQESEERRQITLRLLEHQQSKKPKSFFSRLFGK